MAATDGADGDAAAASITVDESSERLRAAVASAVADGVAEAKRVTGIVLGAFDHCTAVIDALRTDNEDPDIRAYVDELVTAVVTARQRTTERLAAQAARLEAFNLVFFGRTGAGKSTLIEALVGGDGESISPGNMDWTTDVGEVR